MPMRREDKELSKYSKYRARVDLTKKRQVASVLALLARSLGLCWGGCTRSRPLASACVGFACVFGRRESRVVTVVTYPLLTHHIVTGSTRLMAMFLTCYLYCTYLSVCTCLACLLASQSPQWVMYA